MQFTETEITGVFTVANVTHADDRGYFLEWFRADRFQEATGHRFELMQANCSVSSRGTLRGIHYADVPPGQAKFVTCMSGAIIDVAVDLRVGSPTFGRWVAKRLDPEDRQALYLGEGIGHAFVALEDNSTVVYLCSTPYAPAREHEVHPLDATIGIDWPSDLDLQLSPKDAVAPTLATAEAGGALPTYDATRAHIDWLRQQLPAQS